MSSDRPLRPAALAALSILALVALAGCGKKGDPVPPPRSIPQTTTDLTLRQRGDRVLFDFGYPKATVAGLPLSGLETVTLLLLEVPARTDGMPVTVAPEQVAAARPVAELSGPTLGGAVSGDRIRFDAALPQPLPDPPTARIYAVRTKAAGGEVSALSNAAILVPRPAPEGPAELEATPLKQGIELTWSADPGATAGYAVLRRPAVQSGWSQPPVLLEPGTTSWIDTEPRYGERWVYTVLSQASRTPPIESAPRAEREVDYRDQFPPAPPGSLRTLALPGEVRLVWEASADADVTGYRVERAPFGSEAFELVAEVPGGRLEHVDSGLAPGSALRYRVRAVDGAGNVSEPGKAVEARVP